MHIDTHNLLTLRYFSAHKLVIMELNKVELGWKCVKFYTKLDLFAHKKSMNKV